MTIVFIGTDHRSRLLFTPHGFDPLSCFASAYGSAHGSLIITDTCVFMHPFSLLPGGCVLSLCLDVLHILRVSIPTLISCY